MIQIAFSRIWSSDFWTDGTPWHRFQAPLPIMRLLRLLLIPAAGPYDPAEAGFFPSNQRGVLVFCNKKRHTMLWPAQLQTLPLVKGRWHQRGTAFGSVCKIRFIFAIQSHLDLRYFTPKVGQRLK